MTPDTRIGVDNPDTQYMGTVVDSSECYDENGNENAWRVWGEPLQLRGLHHHDVRYLGRHRRRSHGRGRRHGQSERRPAAAQRGLGSLRCLSRRSREPSRVAQPAPAAASASPADRATTHTLRLEPGSSGRGSHREARHRGGSLQAARSEHPDPADQGRDRAV